MLTFAAETPLDTSLGVDDLLLHAETWLVGIVNGLANLRNVIRDAPARSYRPEAHHARLVVNTVKTVADFLFETCEHQRERGQLSGVDSGGDQRQRGSEGT